jgi:hypothetical protein
MKDLRVNVAVTSLLLAGASLLPALAWSMDVMDDSSLGNTTGQDGLTVTLAMPAGLSIDQVAVFDGNGFTGQTGAGALVIGKNANAAGAAAGTNPVNGNGVSIVPSTPTITAVIDASGGGVAGANTGTSPMTNIAINLPTSFTVATGDVGIAVATGTAGNYAVTANTTSPNVGDVLIMNSASINVSFASAPLITIQLGKANQTVVNPSLPAGSQNIPSMIQFTNFNISSLAFTTPLSLASPNGGAVATSQLTMTPVITNLNLTGAGIDLLTQASMNLAQNFNGTATSGGLLFQDASLTVGSIALSNVTAGTVGNSDATFGTMKNASMGSLGVTNMVVTGLKVGVSGM